MAKKRQQRSGKRKTSQKKDARRGSPRKRKKGPDPIRSMLLGAAICTLVIGGLAVVIGRGKIEQTDESATWPTVPGRITSSGVEKYRASRGTQWRPRIRYEYQVGTTRYVSNRITISQTSSLLQSGATKTASRYPANAHVKVHYNPRNPSIAVLQRHIQPRTKRQVLFGVGMLPLSLALFVTVFRRRQRRWVVAAGFALGAASALLMSFSI